MIDRKHSLPITNQAKALGISRSSVYYLPMPVAERDCQWPIILPLQRTKASTKLIQQPLQPVSIKRVGL